MNPVDARTPSAAMARSQRSFAHGYADLRASYTCRRSTQTLERVGVVPGFAYAKVLDVSLLKSWSPFWKVSLRNRSPTIHMLAAGLGRASAYRRSFLQSIRLIGPRPPQNRIMSMTLLQPLVRNNTSESVDNSNSDRRIMHVQQASGQLVDALCECADCGWSGIHSRP